MIRRVSKDIENGSWGEDNTFTGEVTYAVITDSSDGISLFYDTHELKRKDLPIRGDQYEDTSLYVSNISFSRREDRNFKDNGHIGTNNSLSIWNYVVSLTSNVVQVDERDFPDSLSISPKFYEVYDEKQYKDSDTVGEPTGIVLDKAGRAMPSSRQVMNSVLNFSYKMKEFEFSFLQKILGTVNKHAMTVCGIDIPAHCGRMNNITASYNKNTGDFTVTCEVEVKIHKSVYKEELLSKGFYARFPGFNEDDNGVEQSVRLQGAGSIAEAASLSTGSDFETQKKAGKVYGQYKKSVYGYWGDLHNDKQTQDPVIHDPNGYPYIGNETNIQTAIKDKLVGIVYKNIAVPVSWTFLKLPKKGFED